MKITVLSENTAGPDSRLKAEFGLSLLIETGGATLLFDTGASDRFALNADALGVDLAKVDWLVLSHGHYDHGGGLRAFFERNRHAKAVMKPGVERPHVGTLVPGLPTLLHKTHLLTRDIGLDPQVLSDNAHRIVWAHEPLDLAEGIRVLPSIPRVHPLPKGNRFLLALEEGRFVPDAFSHELLLVVDGAPGAVVFSGCAHSGILNMLEAVARDAPTRAVHAVVGGFHQTLPKSEKMSGTSAEVRDLALTLGERVTGDIYTGHCTGTEAFGVMRGVLGERLRALHTGMQIDQ